MALSLLSILSFVALVHAGLHTSRSGVESKAVIVQMFEWNWDSVAAECTNFLGPAGYGSVQVSPAQEHVQGPEWWTGYQAVSYILTSKRGTRDQYEKMIQTCHAAGVKVIADVIWNHMTARDSGKGVAGSDFTRYDYPGIYQAQDFHYCSLKPGKNVDYGNKTEVWTCELVGLADLATDTDYVRGKLAKFTNDLISLGVDGLRVDAAKHMDPDDIANILSRLTSQPYITQEVVWGNNGAVTPALYTGNGDVQEFRYTSALNDAFLGRGGEISSLHDLDSRGWVPGYGANVFVSNQDTERNKDSLNVYSPSNAYTLASVFSLAHPYGRISVYSSYANFFNTPDAGGPNSGAGSCDDELSVDGWFCQHRWPVIAGMVGFRNHVGEAPLAKWVSPSSQQIAFARGSDGFVAINYANKKWSTTFKTGLAGGSYCNVIDGSSKDGMCTGTAFTIGSDGSLTVTVGAHQAIAVHTGALGSETSQPQTAKMVPVLFEVNATTAFGDNIFVVGSVSGLGNSDTSKAIRLDPTNYPLWAATAYLPPNTKFQYNYVRKLSNGTIISESAPIRQDTTPASGILSIVTSWQ